MHFTSSQMRAIWFMVFVFGASVAVHYINTWFFPPEPYDFSRFEQAFFQRRDSLLQAGSRQPAPADISEAPAVLTETMRGAGEKAAFPININTADAAALQALPRIGPAISRRIIDYRRQHGAFTKKSDLQKVKGIGPKTFEKLAPLIVTE